MAKARVYELAKELELIHQNLSKYLKQDAPEIQRSSHNKLPSLSSHNNRQ